MDDPFSGELAEDEQRMLERLPTPPPVENIPATGVWIVEWRGGEDARTGTRLKLWLDIKRKGWARLVPCQGKHDVVAAIKAASLFASNPGTQPLLQIEARIGDAGLEGPGPDGRTEVLSWQELALQLQRLNLATRCTLLVLCPRADGVAARLAACGGERLPCAAVIGPDREVDEDLRLQAMTVLYRYWLRQRPGLEAASAEVAPARMQIESMVETAHARWYGGLVRATRSRDEGELARRLDAYVAGLGPALGGAPMRQDTRTRLLFLPRRLHQAWRSLLMADLYPENRNRYDYPAKAAAWSILRARGLA